MARDKIKILIVEDEYLVAMLLGTNLERFFNYLVSGPVATGEEAIACVATEELDIILMDIRLASAMNGIEAAQKILENHALPIIFLTGYATTEYLQQCRELGAAAVLQKPLSPVEVDAAIRAVIAEAD